MPTPATRPLSYVLFATDFSPAATAVLPFAAEIARCFAANLFVVHAKTLENYALPTPEVWPAANAELEMNTEELKMTLRQPDFRRRTLRPHPINARQVNPSINPK